MGVPIRVSFCSDKFKMMHEKHIRLLGLPAKDYLDEKKIMKQYRNKLNKSLVQPNIDYCSQLYMPVNGNKLNQLESLQRQFTNRIPSANSMDYWARLSHLQMLSQQRRLERYWIIY